MAVLGVLSGKGGVGKTTVASNLAVALSQTFKRKVIVLDSNVHSSHIGLYFGVYDKLPATIHDALKRKKPVEDSIYTYYGVGVDILPSSPTPNTHVDIKNMKALVKELAKSAYDFVVLDIAPGFTGDVMPAIKASDELIVVTTPNIPDVSDALKIMELARKMKKKVKGVVLNRVKGKRYELGVEEVESTLDAPILTVIPDDEKVPESVAMGLPLVLYRKNSEAAVEIEKLAAKIAGEKYKAPDLFKKIKNFLSERKFNFSKLERTKDMLGEGAKK